MFDLEREIQGWRQELLTNGLSGSELDELEDHLRADLEEQLRSDVAKREAFALAVKRIGRGSLPMFDLNRAIAEWRQDMVVGGVEPVGALNELEGRSGER